MELKARMMDWPSLRPVVLHVYEDVVPPVGRDARSSSVGNYYAWLLLKGEVRVENHGRVTVAGAGSWVVAHPGPRYQKFSGDAVILSTQFQARWPDGQPLFDEGLSIAFPAAEARELEAAARRMLDTVRERFPVNPLEIRSALLTLEEYLTFQHHGSAFLLLLFRELEKRGLIPSRVGQTDERLLAVLRRLDGWPLDLPPDWKHIARACGLTADHLSRMFQEAFGLSPAKYLANRRCDYARRLLGHSAIAMKVIAADLGFHAAADFSTWFRRAHGVSPSEYRQRAGWAEQP
ncbi:MAG TPA: AraC family transcriptional regulator [Chthoniobacteraceae bacterium]|nr:AraC family transcriptional regulator [Chthoniobacteraceae bacterium]